MKCYHNQGTSIGFPSDYSFKRHGYLRSVCRQCGAWRYLNNPEDDLWHIPKSYEMSDEDAERISRDVEEQFGWGRQESRE